MRTSILAAMVAMGCAFACSAPATDDSATQGDRLDAPAANASSLVPFGLGGSHTCALARRGITCWGSNTSQQLTVPTTLKHPTQVVSLNNHSCALDDDGVKCWGSNTSGQITVPVLTRPTQVTAGGSHSCAIDATGVKCWGSNTSAQITVPVLSQPTQVRAGTSHTCALDATGVKCWGSNTSGQTTVPVLSHPKQITVGSNHTCAIDDTGVKCWGSNFSMQATPPELNKPTQIVGGSTHTCAIDADGVKCWGSNTSMQSTPPPMRRPTWIAAGRSHTCALDDDQLKCWGSDTSKQVTIPSDFSVVGRHICAVANGGLRCAGDNERGQLGMGDDQDKVVALGFAGVTSLGSDFGVPTRVVVGQSFGCAVNDDGAAKCWGKNAHGQLGVGDTRDRGDTPGEMGDALPGLALPGGVAVAKVEVGADHACAVTEAGELYCWGGGSAGQLGTESTKDVATPTRPRLKAGLGVRDVALGRRHTCALATDARVYCFGGNGAGQLGIGRASSVGDVAGTMGSAMTAVALGDGFRVKSIASGDDHVCALSEDGQVKCWGAATSGQLGLGDARDRGASAEDMGAALPVVDLGHGQVIADMTCGARHCCARTVQNTMKCWGDNTDGQLGLGDVVTRGLDPLSTGDNLPFVMTPPHERVLSISLAGNRTCAKTDSGTRCWGRNRSGELGYGDRELRGGTLTTVPRALAPLGI